MVFELIGTNTTDFCTEDGTKPRKFLSIRLRLIRLDNRIKV